MSKANLYQQCPEAGVKVETPLHHAELDKLAGRSVANAGITLREKKLLGHLTLRGSGLLWRWHTWRDAADFYFGRGGMAWVFAAGTLRFLTPGFRHADGPEDQLARQWFHSNPHTFVEGRRSHPAAGARA